MHDAIETVLDELTGGRITRRQASQRLAAALTALAASLAHGRAEGAESTFTALGLNHVALDVTDVPRSRDFYVRHLGLEVTRDGASSSFLTCGDHFVALFRSSRPGMNHYCYSIADYDVSAVSDRLRAEGLEPRVSGNRVYFDDPDGLEVQLAALEHRP